MCGAPGITILFRLLAPLVLLAAVSALSVDAAAQNKDKAARGGKVAVDSDVALAVAYSPRGSAIAFGGFGGDVKSWDPRIVEHRLTIPSPDRRTKRALAFSPDGSTLAVGGDESVVRLFDVRTGEPRQLLPGHKNMVLSLAYSPNGDLLATAGYELEIKDRKATGKFAAEIRIWETRTVKCRNTIAVPENQACYCLAFSPDGRSLASAEGAVCIRETATGQIQRTFKPERGGVHAVAYSPDGKRIAGAGGYPIAVEGGTRTIGELSIWDLDTGKVRFSRTDLPGRLASAAYSPNGRILATGGDGPSRQERTRGRWGSSEMRTWDAQTGELLRTIEGPLSTVSSLAFSPDGRMILSCDMEEVRLTETATGLRRAVIMTVSNRIRND